MNTPQRYKVVRARRRNEENKLKRSSYGGKALGHFIECYVSMSAPLIMAIITKQP